MRWARFETGRSEARLEVEVGSREAAAGNSLLSCSVARRERFARSILAGNKANSKVPDEVEGAAADHSSRTDSEDMFGNASDAWVLSSRAVDAARIDRAVSVPNHRLFN